MYDGHETSFKSVVVEFDSFLNPDLYDISDNHVGFDFGKEYSTAAADASDVNVLLWDNQTLFVWIDYCGVTQQLEARISNNNSRPDSPLLKYQVDLDEWVDDQMYVGFSAGSGLSLTAYYVSNWSFDSGFDSSQIVWPGTAGLNYVISLSVFVPVLIMLCILLALWCG